MSTAIPLERHSYDVLMKHKNPMALRLNDPHHQSIQVGDIVEYSGHNNAMDRQRFQVIAKMHHPTIHDAVSAIQHSDLSTRDKLQMAHGFLDTHGPAAHSHGVVSLHLAPHPGPSAMNRTPGSLG